MDLGKTAGVHEEGITLSVVIPAFNEELVIEESIKRIRHILEGSKIKNEILVVNDGSKDATLEILSRIKKSEPLRIINLATNSGHMNAIRAGMEASNGDYVLTIDADLQDPPEAIPEMFKIISSEQQIQNGIRFPKGAVEVVQAYRVDRSKDTFVKRTSANAYYFLLRKITGIQMKPHAADYRVMKKDVVKMLISLPEKNLVYRLLIPSLGFGVVYFPITRSERFAGSSKYTMRKMLSLGIDSIISFTYKPLRYLSVIGLLTSGILCLMAILALIASLLGSTVPGWTSLVLIVLSTNVLLFAILGLIGEYVGRIYELAQARPRTLWTEVEN
jgi:glycosyltransferase involved in cell wall biosynthesis